MVFFCLFSRYNTLNQTKGNVDTPMLMAAQTILSLVGIILYRAIAGLEKLIIRWDVGQVL